MFGLDSNTILTFALCGGGLGLLSFFGFALWVSYQVRDARREAEKIRKENELARPVLNGIASEFRTDSGTSFRDSFNRFEAATKRLESAAELQTVRVNEIFRVLAQQLRVNSETDNVLSQLLTSLRSQQAQLDKEGDIHAATALQKLTSELQAARDSLRERVAAISITNTSMGNEAQVGQLAAGAGHHQETS